MGEFHSYRQVGYYIVILHTVNKSPFSHDTLASCLSAATPGASLLLIEDGVYGALDSEKNRDILARAPADLQLYVLAEDLAARGLEDKLLPAIQRVDYAGFVALVQTHHSVSSWY